MQISLKRKNKEKEENVTRGVVSGPCEEMGGRPLTKKQFTFVKRLPKEQFNWHTQRTGSLNRDTMKDAVVIINSLSDIGSDC